MRLWTLHPRYLDPAGLVALWRETLLARAVLSGTTRGYRRHPQLHRFQSLDAPCPAIEAYLAVVFEEAQSRGYRFDRSKLGLACETPRIVSTDGQLACEWRHLLRKLEQRNPARHAALLESSGPEAHPIFSIVPGPVEAWERSGESD
jgi:hypothetical protein